MKDTLKQAAAPATKIIKPRIKQNLRSALQVLLKVVRDHRREKRDGAGGDWSHGFQSGVRLAVREVLFGIRRDMGQEYRFRHS